MHVYITATRPPTPAPAPAISWLFPPLIPPCFYTVASFLVFVVNLPPTFDVISAEWEGERGREREREERERGFLT